MLGTELGRPRHLQVFLKDQALVVVDAHVPGSPAQPFDPALVGDEGHALDAGVRGGLGDDGEHKLALGGEVLKHRLEFVAGGRGLKIPGEVEGAGLDPDFDCFAPGAALRLASRKAHESGITLLEVAANQCKE